MKNGFLSIASAGAGDVSTWSGAARAEMMKSVDGNNNLATSVSVSRHK